MTLRRSTLPTCAVAMGTGTAVAKEASDLVLNDDSFATLVYGIEEGRRIVDNVQKGLVFLLSTHVALLGFILIATIAGFSQALLPIQVLWLELFIDLSASIAFEREPAEPDIMTRPPRRPGRPLLTRELLARIAGAGGFSAVAALWLMTASGAGLEHGRWLAFTALVLAQAVRAYANRSLVLPVVSLRWNGFLLAACLVTVAVQVLIPFVPPLADVFRATHLAPAEWAPRGRHRSRAGRRGRDHQASRARALGGLSRVSLSPVSPGPFSLVGTRCPEQEPHRRTRARRRPGAVPRQPDPARPAR